MDEEDLGAYRWFMRLLEKDSLGEPLAKSRE